MNKDKSLLIPVGNDCGTDSHISGLAVNRDKFEYLGIWFSNDNLDMKYLNF